MSVLNYELIRSKDFIKLDGIEVLDEYGAFIAKIGHFVDLAVEHGETVETRHTMADLALDYIVTFAPNVTHYLPYDASEPASLQDIDPKTYFHSQAEVADIDDIGYDATLYGFEGDTSSEDPTLHYMCAHGGITHRRFSDVSAYLPASWPETKGYPAYVALLRRWCQRLKPAYGTAGLSVLFAEGRETRDDYLAAFPLIKRYPGLDIPMSSRWYAMVGREHRRTIRTINWLTVIDDDFVGQRGGGDALGSSLGPRCDLHRYEGGVIIQAGPKPEFGDLNYGEVPETYRAVARVLKPIRFEAYRRPLLEVPEPLDPIDETLKWARRFD